MILVTGHKGYIGAHLIKKLKELGHEVQGIDLQEEYSKDKKVIVITKTKIKNIKLPKIGIYIYMLNFHLRMSNFFFKSFFQRFT